MALVYDYLLTFSQEVSLFWNRRWTGATVLFFSNRYLTLFVAILQLLTYVHMSDTVSYVFSKLMY